LGAKKHISEIKQTFPCEKAPLQSLGQCPELQCGLKKISANPYACKEGLGLGLLLLETLILGVLIFVMVKLEVYIAEVRVASLDDEATPEQVCLRCGVSCSPFDKKCDPCRSWNYLLWILPWSALIIVGWFDFFVGFFITIPIFEFILLLAVLFTIGVVGYILCYEKLQLHLCQCRRPAKDDLLIQKIELTSMEHANLQLVPLLYSEILTKEIPPEEEVIWVQDHKSQLFRITFLGTILVIIVIAVFGIVGMFLKLYLLLYLVAVCVIILLPLIVFMLRGRRKVYYILTTHRVVCCDYSLFGGILVPRLLYSSAHTIHFGQTFIHWEDDKSHILIEVHLSQSAVIAIEKLFREKVNFQNLKSDNNNLA